ncbi:MAG: low affinity iron permease family protein [Rhizobiaceae bacterium]|nr:low affinity iron permease family protein [Rhizobiaceae bacterium]
MAEKISIFARFATAVSEWTGRPAVFALALASIAVWGLTGPVFGFSETWQLVVNTGTTIITFLMVFVLQNAQSRDTRAIQTKLDELILTSKAENRFIGIENLDEEELKRLNALLGEAAKRDLHARETALSTYGGGSPAGQDDAAPLEPAAPR